MAEEGIKVEAEGGELVLRNNFGDYAIIPKDSRDKVKKLIAEECWSCIDDFVKDLPTYNDYAQEGSLYPNLEGNGGGEVERAEEETVASDTSSVNYNYDLYPITGVREEEIKVMNSNTESILERMRGRDGVEIYKTGELSPDSSELVKNFYSLYDSETYESDPFYHSEEYYSDGVRVLQGVSDERVIESYLQRQGFAREDLSIDHSELEVAQDSDGNLLGYDVFYKDDKGYPRRLHLWEYSAAEVNSVPEVQRVGGQSTSRIKITSKVVDGVPEDFSGASWEDSRGRTHIATFTDKLTGEEIPYDGLEEYGAKFTTYGGGFRRRIEPIGEGVPYKGRMIKFAGQEGFEELIEQDGKKPEDVLRKLRYGVELSSEEEEELKELRENQSRESEETLKSFIERVKSEIEEEEE